MSDKQYKIKCRKCNSSQVQASRPRDFEALIVRLTPAHPYRCSSCYKRFWVWSTGRPYIKILRSWLILIAVIALISLGLQWLFSSPIDSSNVSQNQSTPTNQVRDVADSFGDELVNENLQRDLVTSLAFNEPQSIVEDNAEVDISNEQFQQKIARAQLLSQNNGLTEQQQDLELGDIKVDPEELRSLLKVDINYLIEQWRQAWQSGDTETYLGFYHSDFSPSDDRSLQEWRRQRTTRVTPSKQINLNLSNFDVILDEVNQKSIVSFDQQYQSQSYNDTSRKQLTLVKDVDWKIVSELTID